MLPPKLCDDSKLAPLRLRYGKKLELLDMPPRRIVSLESPRLGQRPRLSVPLSSMKVLDVWGDMVSALDERLGVVGASWESIESELYVTSAGVFVCVTSPESLEPNFESLKVRILSAMH